MDKKLIDSFCSPDRLFTREEIISKPSPVPDIHGVYGWYFKEVPPNVPTDGCVKFENFTLLYVGISPDKKGKPNSKQDLRKRVTYHYKGNAEGSTLRRSLGILLSDISNFPLRRVGSGKRMTFTHAGERWLDDWMERNAFVCWTEHQEPWILEDYLLQNLSLPLNIQGNKKHPFATELHTIRKDAISKARETPIADEKNQIRKNI